MEEGSPAAAAGLEPGMRLCRVAGEELAGREDPARHAAALTEGAPTSIVEVVARVTGPRPQYSSEEALRACGWIAWEQRRAAVRACFTQQVFRSGEPAVLRRLLPAVAAAMLHDRALRSRTHAARPRGGA